MCLSYAPVVIVALAHPRSDEVVEHPGIHFQGDHCMVIDVTVQLSITLPRVWSNATIVAIKATVYTVDDNDQMVKLVNNFRWVTGGLYITH